MCGIAGLMTANGSAPDAGVLDRLQRALRHRGPDGEGRHVARGVGMVQTRLAIIDLVTGDQPIYATAGLAGAEIAIVANGEIYNYVELRAEMKDVPWRTLSDCEPPLYLYLRDGPEFAYRLRGMYALAIHDPIADRLLIARDPFGIKPLYYAETSAGFAFASEPQALVAAGWISPALDVAARDETLSLQFGCGERTLFAGIARVLPGETLVVEKGRIVARYRRPAVPEGAPAATDADTALFDLDRLLNDAVGVHQRSDVPYGMFLSGGVDSSVLLAMMARLNPKPVVAFTVGFSGTAAHDERAHAREVARAARAEHIEVEFDARDFWRLLPEIAATMNDLACDYAVLPTYKLAAAARTAGLKVVLSGEGGDEVFAGYGRYRRAARSRFLFGRAMRTAGTFDGLNVLREPPAGWRDGIAAAERRAAEAGYTPLQSAQAVDCADWLPNDLLTKLDRCLMAHGVEGRVPFLDPLLSDFAFRLPDSLKVRHGLGKWLLRRWLETGLPAAKPFSRKRGFTVPVGEWIAAAGRRIGPLVARQEGVAAACRPGAVERLFAAVADKGGGPHAAAAWHLLFYALWHRRHILGRAPAGDAFETLAAA